MEKILRVTEKFIPKKLYKLGQPIYHYLLSFTGAILYGFPSRKLYVVGITGTKGKSSTTELINTIFEEAGFKTAVAGTIRFKIGDTSRPNLFKMSMPGRFFMQKFFSDAVRAGCTHAVVEMTSEGARFFRHKWIHLDALVFTNLAPEHIESHGSYERYRKAKVAIAKSLEISKKQKPTIIVNTDDKEAEHFLAVKVKEKLLFSLKDAEPYNVNPDSINFTWRGTFITSPLRGVFNLYNILAAATVAESVGINVETIKNAIEKFSEIKGRVQKIDAGQQFGVYVDYAHTIDSLKALYEAFSHSKRICILGNTGGGRDKWKRPEMAKIADTYCDHIILTNEDPYDEDPLQILHDMEQGISNKPYEIILDRREAINKAIQLAQKWSEAHNHVSVLISGKGTDPYIMGPKNSKIPWSDAEVAKEELEKVIQK